MGAWLSIDSAACVAAGCCRTGVLPSLGLRSALGVATGTLLAWRELLRCSALVPLKGRPGTRVACRELRRCIALISRRPGTRVAWRELRRCGRPVTHKRASGVCITARELD